MLTADPARPVPRAFHVMTKPVGAICNLDCEYCFYLAKEQLYAGSSFRMNDEVLERYVAGLLEAHRGADEVVVAFQGGEPTLMGLDFFERVLEVERAYAVPGQRVLNTLQTNATLLDDRWGAFLAREGFLVGASIDGPRAMHDAFRTDKGGKPTFDRVVRGIDVLRRNRVDWNALTTVNAANAGHGAEVYRFLRDELGATFVQLIPVVEREGDGVSRRTVTGDAYGQFLVDVFEEWVRHDVGTVFVQSFDTALAHWLGMPDAGLCVQAETCGRSVALEHNGDVYSCDHFVSPEHLIGNLADGRTLLQIVDSPRQKAFGQAKRDTLPTRCRECEVLFACNGGCPKDRFVPAGDGEPPVNYLCEGYLAFFRHVDGPMRAMADLVRQGRYADDVMTSYTAGPDTGAGHE
ncbi:anaerobic sulfatase maturase [Cellulomonas soli]|uniref:anaerobic sulfatase maturase n=1 Tax=Cellulomonas soli TaxID=931535 RepID=UPI003F86F9E3